MFISTHLLSKKVNVNGTVKIKGSRKYFTITMNRNGSADEIKSQTEKCISDFKTSLKNNGKNKAMPLSR